MARGGDGSEQELCPGLLELRPVCKPAAPQEAHRSPGGLKAFLISHHLIAVLAVLESEKAAFPPPHPWGALPVLSRPSEGGGGRFPQLLSVPGTAARLWVAGAQLAPHGGAGGGVLGGCLGGRRRGELASWGLPGC